MICAAAVTILLCCLPLNLALTPAGAPQTATLPLTYGPSTNLDSLWVPATLGDTCAATCTKEGLKNAYFASAETGVVTSICAANIDSIGWASGWQNATINELACHLPFEGEPVVAAEYACLCLQLNQTQGIFAAANLTQSCNETCMQKFPDQNNVINQGSSVPVDLASQTFACIPSNELGVLNRFGSTNDTSISTHGGRNITCNVAYGETTAAALQYSCFCTFAPVASSITQLALNTGTGSSFSSAAGKRL